MSWHRRSDGSRQAKQVRRKEAELEKKQAQMLRTIGQLTLERDFLQECFRTVGKPIPKHTTMPYLGTQKLVKKLAGYGLQVGRKLVRRLMAEMGMCAVYPKQNLSKRNFKEAIVPYLLRKKVISFPNQVWSIDITYIKMHHSHMYLTAIIN